MEDCCHGSEPGKEIRLQQLKRTRVLIADDDLQMLALIEKLLQVEFDVVDMVSDGFALVEAALKFQPDVIVTDISMPKMNGIEAVRRIHGSLPATKCIFLTMHAGDSYRRAAKAAGAEAYLLKCVARRDLNHAIHCVTGRSE